MRKPAQTLKWAGQARKQHCLFLERYPPDAVLKSMAEKREQAGSPWEQAGSLWEQSGSPWEQAGSKDIQAKAKERLNEILASHHPKPLEPDVQKKIQAIVDRADA